MINFILGILLTLTILFIFITFMIIKKIKNNKKMYNDFFECFFKVDDYE